MPILQKRKLRPGLHNDGQNQNPSPEKLALELTTSPLCRYTFREPDGSMLEGLLKVV